MKTICVVGLGYIGLPTAALLAGGGAEVIGVDIDFELLASLKSGRFLSNESNLQELLLRVINNKQLRFSLAPEPADVYIIAVPTPYTADRKCNLSFVIEALVSILPCLKPGNLVIIESTVPPFTCKDVIKPFLESAGFVVGQDLFLAHCPERLMPGRVVEELVNNHRVVGGFSAKCSQAAIEVYQRFVKAEMSLCDLTTAEMTKLVENTFRDVNIALVNELALICNTLNMNVLEIISLANKHPRVDLLQPGPGVGGHCLAVDPYFIVEKAPLQSRLISTARIINEDMPNYIVNLAVKYLTGIEVPRIGILGVSYKGNVADTRESPALRVIEMLDKIGFEVVVFDPYHTNAYNSHIELAFCKTDLLLILTDHQEFIHLDYAKLSQNMRNPIIIDTRNIVDPSSANNSFKLYNLGNLHALINSL